ncbi:oxidoreductase [Nocardioides phosphati]|uniref:Oxidoreductase n=1 Tax=Nocardioides phosphati TaxID=1867775 RepID=A0ABQ2NF30_9ACTN|nr:glucose 1-dehydrogenase [Nocardioides phosphati]GGO93855.1 oxidoreductase [Nocardioides phosphati]
MGFPAQHQAPPGLQGRMEPVPDCGEETYRGSGRLAGKVALITGADSGIGRAVAIAFAREGADVAISHLPSEEPDAKAVASLVEDAGQRALLLPGDLADPAYCRSLVERTVSDLGKLDVLVCNAAYQMAHDSIADVSDEEWEHTFAVNIGAMFRLVKAALPHLGEGSSIIGSSSVNSDDPNPTLAAYAATKAAIANFCASLAQQLGPRGIRVNSVAPGPVWTPLIPSSFPAEKVEEFGDNTPLGRAAQPAELAAAYVFLASDEASYVAGARLAVTGGRPVL